MTTARKPKIPPGPYNLGDCGYGIFGQIRPGVKFERIAFVNQQALTIEERKGLASLLAASWDLREACKAIVEVAEAFQHGKRDGATLGMVSLAMDAARFALAKSEKTF